MPACMYCEPPPSSLILELPSAILLAPPRPHISPVEGGHLVVTSRSHVADRRALPPAGILAIDLLTMIGADALHAVFGADWQNYQENGNWSPDPENGHAHVHVYGRRRDAVEQPFGEALRFPRRADRGDWSVEAPRVGQLAELRRFAQEDRASYTQFDRAIAAAERGS